MRGVLVDAGPLVAIIHKKDAHHERAVAALGGIKEPLYTAWPAVAEAMYLLGFSWTAQEALWEMLETDAVSLRPIDTDEDLAAMRTLMEKYRDLPMDLADAALVRVAERDQIHRIFTFDGHFRAYRSTRLKRLTLIPGPEPRA